MGGGDLAVLAIWAICLGVSLAVSVLTGWRRPGRSGDGAGDAPAAGAGIVDAASGAAVSDASGGMAEAVAGIAANASGAPAAEQRPPAA